jgi:hypothetical protein
MTVGSKQISLIWWNKTVVQFVFVQGDGKMVPDSSWGALFKATGKGAKKGAKGSKKGQKRHPQRVVVAASCNNDDIEVNGSDEEYVQAPGMVAEWALQETSRNSLSEPCIPHQTQDQRVHHDEELVIPRSEK